jgi:hypothetical protein
MEVSYWRRNDVVEKIVYGRPSIIYTNKLSYSRLGEFEILLPQTYYQRGIESLSKKYFDVDIKNIILKINIFANTEGNYHTCHRYLKKTNGDGMVMILDKKLENLILTSGDGYNWIKDSSDKSCFDYYLKEFIRLLNVRLKL